MKDLTTLKALYQPGRRIRLIKMEDMQAPPVGTRGTIRGVDDIGSVMVAWDNGSGLNVIPDVDVVEVLLTLDELKAMSNEKISISKREEFLILKSQSVGYADSLRLDFLEDIVLKNPNSVKLSIPKGSFMGDTVITLDFSTGYVTINGRSYNQPPISQKKSTALEKRFHPSINGFSITNVRTMPSEDGYAIYAEVLFNNQTVGRFIDKGDGSEYSFYANTPYSTRKIDKVVRNFPSTCRDYGLGELEVEYDMGQMVDALIEMEDIAKHLKKLQIKNMDYVILDAWKENRHFTAEVGKETSNEKLLEEVKRRGVAACEIRRFSNLDDLIVINVEVLLSSLK